MPQRAKKVVRPTPWDFTRRNGHCHPLFKVGDRIMRGNVKARVVSRYTHPILIYRLRLKSTRKIVTYDGEWVEEAFKKMPHSSRKNIGPVITKRVVSGKIPYGIMKFLRELGVSFKHRKHRSFWLTNEADLEFIFHDFQIAAKARRVLLHPDRGHCEETAKTFNARCDMVEKQFKRHGVGRF